MQRGEEINSYTHLNTSRSPDGVSWKMACSDAAVSADLKDEVGNENSNIGNKRNPLFSEQVGAAE